MYHYIPAARRCFSLSLPSLNNRIKKISLKFRNVSETVAFTQSPGFLPHCCYIHNNNDDKIKVNKLNICYKW